MKQKKDNMPDLDDFDAIYDQEYIKEEFKFEINDWKEQYDQSSDYRQSY